MHKILIADDEPNVRYSFKKLLKDEHLEVIEAANGVDALRMFSQKEPDLVVMDIEMPGMTGLEAIRRLKEINPRIPVIVVTAFGSSDRVIEAMKQGAYEYLEKPFDIEKMRSVIREALGIRHLGEGGIYLSPSVKEAASAEKIVGNSQAIKEVYKMIGRVAASDASVLISGESGTGKELVARAIHMHSNRASRPFLTINCAAIPDTLLESELFGFEKGSFTDAGRARTGKFESADTGTVFLDEIGDMSLPVQAKLLRVLQEGTFERLGSNKPIKVDVRIIAATNKELEKGILDRTFREDLYYRLKVITISLPPLRMRREDIPLLTRYFVARHGQAMNNPGFTLTRETMDQLMNYEWPGNVRELENVIKRALLLSKNQILSPDLLSLGNPDEPPADTGVKPATLLAAVHFPAEPDAFEGSLYNQVIDQTEKELLRQTLDHTRGNQVKAAKLLGISRVKLHDRMKKYGLDQ